MSRRVRVGRIPPSPSGPVKVTRADGSETAEAALRPVELHEILMAANDTPAAWRRRRLKAGERPVRWGGRNRPPAAQPRRSGGVLEVFDLVEAAQGSSSRESLGGTE